MKTVVAGALGECVHVAGIVNFLRLAELTGWRTVFLGPAVSIERFLEAAQEERADIVCLSYRLTPETGEGLLTDFVERAARLRKAGVRFAFAGTPPVAERARSLGFFEQVFEGGESPEAVLAYLKGQGPEKLTEADVPQKAVERIEWKAPFPIFRHHFGLPTVEETRRGIERIAGAGVLDVISLGTDQDAQEHFFKPEKQEVRRAGAGGVPVRSPDDFRALYAASRRGNYPLLRTYTGTDDFIRLAEVYVETIKTAWGAVPIFWFNDMDGRGPWDLEGSIREHQRLISWYGERDIPVEVNEPHHWALRDAPDVIFAVAAYLSAYNARALGVRDYIAQMMFNSPAGLSDAMDLAKMMACLELTEPLAGPEFRIWRQTRTGLLSYPLDPDAARAHLAASVYLQMVLRPHIIHIVGYTEAHHAATADDIIGACRMASRAVENALRGQPDMTVDPMVCERRDELVREAQITLEAIRGLGGAGISDPLTDPAILTRAVTEGILDAPHLGNNRYARGLIFSVIDDRGACIAADPESGEAVRETDRLAALGIGDIRG